MIENIRLSFQGIWSHKMRSFLTMLGIIIGIAAIIAIVSTIQGTNEQIKENLIGSGNNTVDIKLYQGEWEFSGDGGEMPTGVTAISQKQLEEIEKLEGVESASLYIKTQDYNSVFYKNTSLTGATIIGGDFKYLDTAGFVVKSGRGFVEEDYTQYRKVAILDEDAANGLFQTEKPLGKTIEIKGEPFIVIGIIGKQKETDLVIDSYQDYYTYMGESSSNIYIPDADWPIIYQYDQVQNVLVKAHSTDEMSTAGQNTADYLNQFIKKPAQEEGSSEMEEGEDQGEGEENENFKYKADNLLEQAKQLQELSASTNQLLIWVASISLLVGGIGVMNIMLVSVTERTREIGLKKAIGARKGRILAQFLTESVVLTSFGGLLGVIGGVGLAKVIANISSTPVSISVPASVIAVLFSMVIGVVFGLLPSYKAANLNPIEALRHE